MKRAAIGCLIAACAGAPPPRDARVQLTIENDGAAPICDVYMRPWAHVAAGWGRDWLDRSETIGVGVWRTFRVEPGDAWDLRLVDCAGGERALRAGVVREDLHVAWSELE